MNSSNHPASVTGSDRVPAPHQRPRFDAERLEVYRVALAFQVVSAGLLRARGQASLRDQLDRASASIVLNIAEGVGRLSRADKARFYAIARGSATECAAIVDIVVARGLCSNADGDEARTLLLRVVQMLSRLIARMAG
jgi:four helix bundle protein